MAKAPLVISVPPGPEDFVGSQASPSEGSKLHGSGACSPCAWYWKPSSCQNGQMCTFCHLCPHGELKARKKAKLAARRLTESTLSPPERIAAKPHSLDAPSPLLQKAASADLTGYRKHHIKKAATIDLAGALPNSPPIQKGFSADLSGWSNSPIKTGATVNLTGWSSSPTRQGSSARVLQLSTLL